MTRVRDDHLSERKVLGRQPESWIWTPSKAPSPWFGEIIEGERFTGGQQRALIALGRDIATAEAMTVQIEEKGTYVWVPSMQWRPIWQFECPVLRRLADGKVEVISPSGRPAKVRADGWAQKPTYTIHWDLYR